MIRVYLLHLHAWRVLDVPQILQNLYFDRTNIRFGVKILLPFLDTNDYQYLMS